MVKNKRGWLRIAEAFIAIILITVVLITVYTKTIQNPKKAEEIYSLEKAILDEIAFNDALRNAVLVNNTDTINDFVENRVRDTGFNFTIKICETKDICNPPVYKKDYYAKDRIISSNLTIYQPKKIKIFMWME